MLLIIAQREVNNRYQCIAGISCMFNVYLILLSVLIIVASIKSKNLKIKMVKILFVFIM